ncbi:MAG TPA: hypothetical protein VIU86_04780 [Gaiellaceae bacterium]
MLSRERDLDALRDRRPFRRRGLVRRTAIFPLALALTFALYPFGRPTYDVRFALAAGAAAAFVVVVLLTPWERLPQTAQVVPPLLYLLSVALLRDAHEGAASGYAPFTLVAVLWLALYGSRVELAAGVLAAGLALVLPILIVGGHAYPTTEWRRAAGIVLVGAAVGYIVQSLLGRLLGEIAAHAETERRLREAEAYELHDDVVQNLTVAQLSLSLDDREAAGVAVGEALTRVQRIVARLLESSRDGGAVAPGSLVRAKHSAGD